VIRSDTPASAGEPTRKSDAVFLTPDMYVERDDPYFKTHGFFERSIANRVEEFGNLVHVWTTYESRHTAEDARPFTRGINSIQIVHAQGRFWIASTMWDDERSGLTLPKKYLTNNHNPVLAGERVYLSAKQALAGSWAAFDCPSSGLFVQVESPPLEISER
jgi:hypothetical protein